MKGINLKKIGAIVAGAAILATSVAHAGLFYENTELVDANGQPVAKVVLGSGAAPSDGVVAAAIAAKLASAAFKKETLTAAVSADATCTPSAEGSETGTCTVSDKKVTLEVTVPGTTSAGVHAFTTLIGDYLDKSLENRYDRSNDDIYNITAESESDVMSANPFDVENGTALLTEEAIYGIYGSDFALFETKPITDPDSGDSYTEYQMGWVKGINQFVEADNAIETSMSLLALQYKFDESKHAGIPVCTEDKDGDKNWADCGITTDENNPSAATVKHRVKVQFLGSEWIITEMVPTTTTIVNDEKVEAGGSVTLAKESVYGIVNVGDSLTSKDGQLQIRLDDISTLENTKPAIVSFLDANGNVLSQDQIAPGSTVKKTIGGNTYKVRVYQTAPGYTFGAKWAEMALLENELKLTDDSAIDDQTVNEDWTVRVLWKNREGTSAASDADSLRGILLYRSAFGDALMPGDSVDIVGSPVVYKFSYLGLDLTSSDYDTLKYQTGSTVTLSLDPEAKSGTYTCELAANEYIKVTSQVDEAFKYSGNDESGDAVTGKGKEFYYLIATPTPPVLCADPDNSTSSADAGDLLMKKSGGSKYVIFNTTSGSVDVEYKTAGTSADTNDGGALQLSYNGSNSLAHIILYEDMGKVETISGTDDHAVSKMGLTYDITSGRFESYDGGGAGTDNEVTVEFATSMGNATQLDDFGYVGEGSTANYEEGKYISPRGSKFESVGTSSAQFKVAKKLGKAQYQFATTEAASGEAATTQLTLAEGQSGQVGDITIKAKSIDVTVGACSAAGGSATCTVPKDQISAVIMPNNAASADVAVPYAVNPKLVVLDKDAAAVSTGVLITVGGDKVNSVTADVMAGADIDFTATPVVVKVINNKIVVAGLTAEDTVAAGDQFLAALKSQ